MKPNIKFYKIKFLIEFNNMCNYHRQRLIDELLDNGTDPVIVMRRMRMIANISEYQSQMTTKLMNFETEDIEDLNLLIWHKVDTQNRADLRHKPEVVHVINRSA